MTVMSSSQNILIVKATVQENCRTGNYTLLVVLEAEYTEREVSTLTNGVAITASGVKPGEPHEFDFSGIIPLLEPGETYRYNVSLVNTDGALVDGMTSLNHHAS